MSRTVSPAPEDEVLSELMNGFANAQAIPVYGRVTAFDRSISLIFEGYTDNDEMMELADLIKERKIDTIFFIPGVDALDNPEVVDYIAKAGISIGNYGLTGERKMELNKAEKNLRQFYRTKQAIIGAATVTPKYLRCNQTEYNEELLKLADLCELDAAVQPNIFLNHRSFASQEQANNFVRSIPRGSVVSIKLGQELDATEINTPAISNARPAVDFQPTVEDEIPEEPREQNNLNIIDLVTWIIDAGKLEGHEFVSLKKLQEIGAAGIPEKEVPAELLEKLNISLYPKLNTPEPFGVQEREPVDDTYFDKVVFVGDSIGVGIENYVSKMRGREKGFFGEAQFLAAGGLSVRNALWQISEESRHPIYNGEQMQIEDAIAQMDVDKVYIMLGMNDILLSDIDTYLTNYQILINLIREKSPGIEIFIQSITPGTDKDDLVPKNIQIFTYNLALVEFCAKYDYHFIDVATALRGDAGMLPEELCSDTDGMGFHFTDAACAIWAEYIRTHTVG